MLKAEKARRNQDRRSGTAGAWKGLTTAILAGGLGTRLRPVVSDRPKVLAEVHHRPHLTHIFDQLAGAGIREVVLLTGYQAEQVFQTVGETYGPLKLVYSPEAAPLGTAGALRNALAKLSGPDVLLLNGDSWCDADLGDFRNFHRLTGADLSMVLVQAADPSRYGKVQAARDGRIARFEEKKEGDPGWINAGIYLLARTLIAEVPAGPEVSLEGDMIPRWVGLGKKIYGYRHAGRFLDIGTPVSYASAEMFIPEKLP